MRALIAVEFRRLLGRRLLHGLTMLVTAALLFAGVAGFIASDDSRQAIAAADAARAAEMTRCVTDIDHASAARIGEYPPEATADPKGFCEENVWVSDPRFAYTDLRWMLGTFAVPVIMLAWLIGASFMGAEWASRGITTLLTWEPRRMRVMTAKIVAVSGVAFAWALLVQLSIAGALYPAAEFEGSMVGVDGAWLSGMARFLLRSSVAASGAAVIGVALAAIGRNTAAAFGAGVVYLTAIEGAIRALKPGWANWLVGDNLALILFGSAEGPQLTHSQAISGLLLLGYAAAIAVLAFLIFRRREIA
ncbi:MAG: hypothetical protein ABR505_04495 [Actinomycetota bacterium]